MSKNSCGSAIISQKCSELKKKLFDLNQDFGRLKDSFNEATKSEDFDRLKEQIRIFEQERILQFKEECYELLEEVLKQCFSCRDGRWETFNYTLKRDVDYFIIEMEEWRYLPNFYFIPHFPIKLLNYIKEIRGDKVTLDLKSFQDLSGVNIPKVYKVEVGVLKNLENLRIAEGVKVLKILKIEAENLKGLEIPKNLIELEMNLKTTEGLKLPKGFKVSKFTLFLEEYKGLEIPDGAVIGEFDLNGVTSAQGLKIGKNVKIVHFKLLDLSTCEGLNLPNDIKIGKLDLFNVTDITGFKIPSGAEVKKIDLSGINYDENLLNNLIEDGAKVEKVIFADRIIDLT